MRPYTQYTITTFLIGAFWGCACSLINAWWWIILMATGAILIGVYRGVRAPLINK